MNMRHRPSLRRSVVLSAIVPEMFIVALVKRVPSLVHAETIGPGVGPGPGLGVGVGVGVGVVGDDPPPPHASVVMRQIASGKVRTAVRVMCADCGLSAHL